MLLFLLLLGGAALAIATARPIDDVEVDRVVAHAIIAETNTAVLRKLQVALSMAGRLSQADVVYQRANAIDGENARELAMLRQVAVSVPVQGQVITATQIDPRMQRALEWSKMYGITVEEALRRMAEKGL